MSAAGGTKLLFPGLAGFYASTRDIGYTMVRVVIGIIFTTHGGLKLSIGHAGIARYFGGLRFPAPDSSLIP